MGVSRPQRKKNLGVERWRKNALVCEREVYYVVRYLALIAALAGEADYVFIPEWPPKQFWEEELCNKLEMVS